MRARTLRWVLVVAITLLAAFLRLYRIDSLPPSDGYDQATYGLDVLDILDGARPVFLPSNFGREALFSYLITLVYLVVGDPALAVYVTSALAGVLAVPAVYWAAEELLATQEGALAHYGSLIAALAIAVSYWHLSWSRLGMRVILVPLLAALVVATQWRGFRTGSRWAYAACGASLGLSLHTYQAARALPLLVLLGFAYHAWSRRSVSRRDLLRLGLVLGIALVVFAPLGVYFLTHPGSSGLRIGQTLVVNDEQDVGSNLRVLVTRARDTLLAFSIRGDTDARVSIPGRPALNPVFSALFWLGVVVSLLRLRDPRYLYLLTWLGGLTAPAALAQYGAFTKRALGATPAIAMLIAVGCLAPWDWVHTWLARHRPSRERGASTALTVLLAIGLAYSGVRTYRDYFLLWSSDPDLFTHFETGQSAIGRYIRDLPSEERIYLSPVPADHHSVVLNSGRRSGYKSYQGRFCMVVPQRAAQDTTYVIVPADDKTSMGLLETYLPQGSVVAEGPLHYNLPYYLAYRVPAGSEAQIRPQRPIDASWGAIALLGYDLDAQAYGPGETIHITLYHLAQGEMNVDYTVFVHLLGPTNPASGTPLWAQDDSEPCRQGYPTSIWEAGEIVIDRVALTIPGDAPAGTYQLAMGFYDWRTMIRLPMLGSGGEVVGDHAVLGEVTVQ